MHTYICINLSFFFFFLVNYINLSLIPRLLWYINHIIIDMRTYIFINLSLIPRLLWYINHIKIIVKHFLFPTRSMVLLVNTVRIVNLCQWNWPIVIHHNVYNTWVNMTKILLFRWKKSPWIDYQKKGKDLVVVLAWGESRFNLTNHKIKYGKWKWLLPFQWCSHCQYNVMKKLN